MAQENPSYAVDLITLLDKQYPPLLPLDTISERELWGKIYQRRLVESLIARYKPDNEREPD